MSIDTRYINHKKREHARMWFAHRGISFFWISSAQKRRSRAQAGSTGYRARHVVSLRIPASDCQTDGGTPRPMARGAGGVSARVDQKIRRVPARHSGGIGRALCRAQAERGICRAGASGLNPPYQHAFLRAWLTHCTSATCLSKFQTKN